MGGKEQKPSVVTKKFKDAKCNELLCYKCPFGNNRYFCLIDKTRFTFGEIAKLFTDERLETEVEAIEE